MKLAITGTSGFVGSRFLEYNSAKYTFHKLSLRDFLIEDLDLVNVGAVLHLAGKAHQMKAIEDSIYFHVNFEMTKALADQAKRQGVPLFVFVSSVKVYGDKNDLFVNEDSECKPTDAYGKSKLMAEEYLRSIESDQFKVAIVRPPLVYGPRVKGNMIRFLRLAEKNIPLPFGGDANQRSMVFIDNLVALINRIIETGASGTFVAGDRQPLSTGKLMSLIRGSMKKRAGLVTVPSVGRNILKSVSPKLFNRLFGSFVIDNSNTNKVLAFTPPVSTEEGIRQMVNWYLQVPNEGNLRAAFNKK